MTISFLARTQSSSRPHAYPHLAVDGSKTLVNLRMDCVLYGAFQREQEGGAAYFYSYEGKHFQITPQGIERALRFYKTVGELHSE